MSGKFSITRLVGSVAGGLAAVLVAGVLSPPSAQAWTSTLQYTCSGPGFGSEPPYTFAAVLESDLPATMPYGTQRQAAVTTVIFANEPFRAWAQSAGFTVLYAGVNLGTALDGVAQPTMYQSTPGIAVPTSPGTWTWTTQPTSTTVSASTVGAHAFTVTNLGITVAFHDAGGPALATSATCVVDSSTPGFNPAIDTWDTVAATTATSLSLKGDVATATVTSNGAAPAGLVNFALGGKSVTMPVASGKATAKLPSVRPGDYTVSATFVPDQPSQLTSSTSTASYTVPRIATKSRASATHRTALDLVKARARVRAADGSDVSGRVTFILKRNGKTVRNATVRLSSNDAAVKRFRKVPANGKYLVVAKYLGTSTFEPSKDRYRFTAG